MMMMTMTKTMMMMMTTLWKPPSRTTTIRLMNRYDELSYDYYGDEEGENEIMEIKEVWIRMRRLRVWCHNAPNEIMLAIRITIREEGLKR